MTANELVSIFEETEDIYLDGFLHEHELPEPSNQLLFDHHELREIHRTVHNQWISRTSKEHTPNILVAKGDTINYIIDNNIEKPLVLNFANPIVPGGGVRRGAKAQEEDLCRSSNLLYALESEDVREYYSRNRLYGNIGSNNAILTKDVSIIRHTNGALLAAPILMDVLTIAAPIVNLKEMDEFSHEYYYEKLCERVTHLLNIAQYHNYKELILGAWGCGAFNNDPKDVASAFGILTFEGKYLFEKVHFVIKADSERGQHNYNTFYIALNNCYPDK